MTYDFKAESRKLVNRLAMVSSEKAADSAAEQSLREAAAAAYRDIENHFDSDQRRCSCEREACGFCEMLGWLRTKSAAIRGTDGNTKGQ